MLEIGRRSESRSKSRFEFGWYNARINSGIAPSMVPHSKKRIPRLPHPLNTNPYGGRQCTHHSIPYDAMRTRVASPDQNHSLPGPDQEKRGRRRNVWKRDRKRLDVETCSIHGSSVGTFPAMFIQNPSFDSKTPPTDETLPECLPCKRFYVRSASMKTGWRGNVFSIDFARGEN